MSTRTLPRLPLIRYARANTDVADAATTTDPLTSAETPADDASVVAQAQRVRRTATIVVTALVLSALTASIATVLARRYVKARDAA